MSGWCCGAIARSTNEPRTAVRRFRAAPDRLRQLCSGPVFGAACFLATCTGVIVALGACWARSCPRAERPARQSLVCDRGQPARTLRAGSQAGRPNRQSSDPAAAGFRVGHRRAASGCWAWWRCSAIPVGVGAGVYLEEYARPGRLRRIIQTNIANLAGVPSIVYGILGLALFVRAFGLKALALGPTLCGRCADAEPADLADHRDHDPGGAAHGPQLAPSGGAGLGATRWQMVRGHVCPSRLAGHHDRHDPRPFAGHRRDGSAAHGRRGGRDPQAAQGAARSLHGACPSRFTTTPRSRTRDFQTVAAGGILILLDPLAAR